MRTDTAGIDPRPYFPYAAAATLGVVVLPGAIVFTLLMTAQPPPPLIVTSVISVMLSLVASIVGSALWMRHPSSLDVSFGDLMLWVWFRHVRAERRLNTGTESLGLDRVGRRVDEVAVDRDSHLKILHDLAAALEAKDPYTHGHSRRVARHAFRTAVAMGLSLNQLEVLRTAALLHDVGKVSVPEKILRKEGSLTDEEYRLVQEHSAAGARMADVIGNPEIVAAIRHHHERWDGKGYPDGVSGTRIPLLARIIAVADTFDAITSTRPYRAKESREHAIRIIKEEAGHQLDPHVVKAFLAELPHPVPMVASLAFLPVLNKMLREAAFSAKQASVTTLATAVGASASIAIAPIAGEVKDTKPRERPATVVATETSSGATQVPASRSVTAITGVSEEEIDAIRADVTTRRADGGLRVIDSSGNAVGLSVEEAAAIAATHAEEIVGVATGPAPETVVAVTPGQGNPGQGNSGEGNSGSHSGGKGGKEGKNNPGNSGNQGNGNAGGNSGNGNAGAAPVTPGPHEPSPSSGEEDEGDPKGGPGNSGNQSGGDPGGGDPGGGNPGGGNPGGGNPGNPGGNGGGSA